MSDKINHILYELDCYMIEYLNFARDYTASYARIYKRDEIKIQIQNNNTLIAVSFIFDGNLIAFKNFQLSDGTRNQVYTTIESFIHDSVNVISELKDRGYLRMPE